MKKPRSLLRTAMYVVLVVLGVLVYAYGWKITDINLEVPQDKDRQEQVARALRGLLSPDLFERDEESQVAYAHFLVPCADSPPDQPQVVAGQPTITLSPSCGSPNEKITIEGFNFHPYTDAYIRWTPPGRSKLTRAAIRTDGEGHFRSSELRVPTASESDEIQIVEVEAIWSVGAPRPSEALKVTAERMVETIFLALMATTLAIIVALPVSFIAAYNLMRQVRVPLGNLLASLLPLPLLVLARQILREREIAQALRDWLILRPVGGLGLRLGSDGWWGVPTLLLVFGMLYLVFRYLPRVGPISNRLLVGVTRYVRMLLVIVLFLFVSGVVSGVGSQIGLALSGVLGGILGNVLGTLAESLRLLLPLFGGLAVVLVLGSLAGMLLEGFLERAGSGFFRRALGLLLGALVGGLLFYLVYRGVNEFYTPGEPTPYAGRFAVAGAVLGGILGLVLGTDYPFPAGLAIYYLTRTVLNGLRSIEPLIWGIVFVIWVSIGPFAGVLALTIHSIAALGKLYSEQVESIDHGPIEAITATGATRLQTILYGVVPQIVPSYIAFTLYRWDINVRMSTIIGFVGGGGIGFVLQQWINLLQYRQAGVAVLAIAVVVAALDYVSAQARERVA